MISSIVSRLVILVFGTLYPAYASYKAVRTKNLKEYVKWMMYWIVFALFTCAETFTDVFFSFWFPFYYEIKIILVLWLLSPATKGSSILYRRFVHPALIRREAEIDDALARATEQGYTAVLHLGTKGVNYATTVLMQTAIKGGGGLVQQLKKSYSLSDLTGDNDDGMNRNNSSTHDETDLMVEPRRRENPGRRGFSPRRTQSSCNRVDMFYSDVEVDIKQSRYREPLDNLNNIKSSDDISSGYSSGEAAAIQTSHRVISNTETLLRTSSVGARTRSSRPRSTTKKSSTEDEEEDWIEFNSLSHLIINMSIRALELLNCLSKTPNDVMSENPNRNRDIIIQVSTILEEISSLLNQDFDNKTNIINCIEKPIINHGFSKITDNQLSLPSLDIPFQPCEQTKLQHLKTLLLNTIHKLSSNAIDYQKNSVLKFQPRLKQLNEAEFIVNVKSPSSLSSSNVISPLIQIRPLKAVSPILERTEKIRGGKYNKTQAPKPPVQSNPTEKID
ncbi:uncharacterized protein [Chelonus insularis]|uniref:uncharacterized protein isoform X2 n=1 Tax=Chelonus insularis TaxID=460826 RepID=UPI00158DCB5B|nr:uncharacterized protein LOC118073526 isoform X2 [Chelonus insularis]